MSAYANAGVAVSSRVVVHLAEALYKIRCLLLGAAALPTPASEPRSKTKDRPIYKIGASVAADMAVVAAEIAGALVEAGEDPGWLPGHADALKLAAMGRPADPSYRAPQPVASDEARARIVALEKSVKGLQRDLDQEKERVNEMRCAAHAHARGRDADDGVQTCLEEARMENGSVDDFTELSRFAVFCARLRFAGTVPNLLRPGETIGPLVDDDPCLPVAVWSRAPGRERPSSVEEAAPLYVAWLREANDLFRRKMNEV